MTARGPITFLLAVLGVGVSLSLVMGCGGGEEHLTKAQFLKQGDAICRPLQKGTGRPRGF